MRIKKLFIILSLFFAIVTTSCKEKEEKKYVDINYTDILTGTTIDLDEILDSERENTLCYKKRIIM